MQPDVIGSLEDILEAIAFIEEDTSGLTRDEFLADRRARNLVERHFTVIGEAVTRLQRHAPDTAGRITGARQIVDFRNVVVHGYDVIDYRRVWNIVDRMLPVLQSEVERILAEVDDGEPT